MIVEVIELRWPSYVVHLVEPGVLDDRARLAFGAGQCHGLALALKEQQGWPLVAVDDQDGRRIHICVRRPDGALVDVNGAHADGAFSDAWPGCSLHDINADDVDDLVQNHGWAPPEIKKASGWVGPILDQASDPSRSRTPLQIPTLERVCDVEELEVRFLWKGDPGLDVHVRRSCPPGGEWVCYSYLAFPPDSSGRHVIDFRRESFASLTQTFLRRQFDPAKARTKIANA